MSDTEQCPDYYNASWMALQFEATSKNAMELGQALYQYLFPSKVKAGPGSPPDHEARRRALLAIVADVLLAARRDPERLVYRSCSRSSFTGERVSYRNFRAVEEALVEHQFLIKYRGSWTRNDDGLGQDGGYGHTTRWKGTEKLFKFCQQFQITSQVISSNFSRPPPDVVVEVRAPYVTKDGRRQGGNVLSYPKTDRSEEIEGQVREINEFLDKREIEGAIHLGFQRKFNNAADIATYEWNQGGRLYSINYPDSYQCLPSTERRELTIDGQQVVEIDIRSSQLTIYHALLGEPFDPEVSDPYRLGNIDRDLAKSWFVIAIGQGRFPTRWPTQAVADYRDNNPGRELGRNYPIRHVQAAFIKKYPAIEKLPKSGLHSLVLSYHESEAIIAAMLELLRKHAVPSLPVHDSLIVPERHQELAKQVMEDRYSEKVGIKPFLTVKGGS